MAYIKAQKLVRNNSGRIVSGSAVIVVTAYDPKANHHTRKSVRERLGKVLFLSEDKKSGIFLSTARGLVEYNSITDEFREIEHANLWKKLGSLKFSEAFLPKKGSMNGL